MEFRVLGPLQVIADDRPVALGGVRQERVLAALLLAGSRPVSLSRLAEVAYDDPAPEGLRRRVQNRISSLRAVLADLDSEAGADMIVRNGAGYLLRVAREQIDAFVFQDLAGRARDLADRGDRIGAARLLRQALALWRGPALDGLACEALHHEIAGLDDARLTALEDCLDFELTTTVNIAQLVSELRGLVARHPLRQRFVGQLMTALYLDQQQAAALTVYQELARRLADEHGLDPGPQLRHLHLAILRDELPGPLSASISAPAVRPPQPAQLPPDTPGFTGRSAQLTALDAIAAAGPGRPTAVVVSTIAGTAGAGKTALAVHWAHSVKDRFPDGQLYINLRGFDPGGVVTSPADAIQGLLDALGVPPHSIPADFDAQLSLYRTVLADRRMLIVLDNARDADQVRPLLPGSPSCFVLVTSRNQMTPLVAVEGAHPLTLDLLDRAESRELLARRLGPQRVNAEAESVDEIITRCAGLPLALTIAAARSVTRPNFPLAALAADLSSGGDRFGGFTGGDATTDLRAVFSSSYRVLNPEAARLFRLLGLHPGPAISASAAASLADRPVDQTRSLLTELAQIHLLLEPEPDRYTVHDLLRAYANELANQLEPAEQRQAAVNRLLDHYLDSPPADVQGGPTPVSRRAVPRHPDASGRTPPVRRRRAAGRSVPGGVRPIEAAEQLAEAVRRQWRHEENLRRVHDPVPLAVRWHPAPEEIVDHWPNIRRTTCGAADPGPLDVAGHLSQIADIYRQIPSGRLVILGQPGAGKTVLAARLAVELLATRRPDQPVPVIVSIASWNPTTGILDWLAAQLVRDHPGLALVHAHPRGLARSMIDDGLILPVLDGFDEIAEGHHRSALEQLNDTPDLPLIVTSRIVEYTAAVKGSDVLTGAAGIELDQLTLDSLTDYLPRTTRRRTTRDDHLTGLWEPVLNRLRDQPTDPASMNLRQALSTPLMVYLARTIYSDTPACNPADLLDIGRFPTATAVEQHLIATYVPAIYRQSHAGGARSWRPEQARRWLAYLARSLDRIQTRDLAWWQLHATIPRPVRVLANALVGGLVGGLVYGLTGGLQEGVRLGLFVAGIAALIFGAVFGIAGPTAHPMNPPRRPRGKLRDTLWNVGAGLVTGLTGGFVGGVMAGLVFAAAPHAGLRDGLVTGVSTGLLFGALFGVAFRLASGVVDPGHPARTRLRLRGRARLIGLSLAGAVIRGSVGGSLLGLPLWLLSNLDPASESMTLPQALAAGSVGGFVFGLAAGLATALNVPVDIATTVNALDSLKADRTNTVFRTFLGVLVGGSAGGLVGWFTLDNSLVILGVMAFGLPIGLSAGAWGRWAILIRIWLPLTGRLPWAVMAFLDDAHRRGVLRQSGAVYQFRHDRLQDHLSRLKRH